ncbi:hypothetical protein ACFFHH_17610 [Cytobacillus solani]|uniref:hypothetical protein n=1 Tax=Cytobacillus solani TaxID=1637975 RepID=UPI000A42F571
MSKNLLSIAILILAMGIVFVNVWKPSQADGEKDLPKEEAFRGSEEIPGADLSKVKEGRPAPDFELTTLDGEIIKLSDYKGKRLF